MAPEQALGQGDVRSDIYSLGVVLYQMVTGTVPYSGSTPLQVLMQQTNAALPDPRTLNPGLPLRLVQVLQTALAKDPNARFQSAQALGMAVQQVQTEMQAQPGLRPSAWLPGAGVSAPARPAAPAPTPPAPPYPGAAIPYAPTTPVSLPPGAAGGYTSPYNTRPASAGGSSPLPAESFNMSSPTGAFYAPPGAPPSQPGWSAPVSGFGAPPGQQPGMPPYAPGYSPPGFPGGPGAPAPRKNQTGLIAILAALTLIVVLGGSFVVLGANGKGPLAGLGNQQTPTAQVTPTPAATPTPTVTPTPSAPPGYKLYTNDPANTFSLDYPSDWSESATSEGTGAQFVGTLAQVVIVTDLGRVQGQPAVLDNAFCEGSNGSGGFGGKPTRPVQVTLGGQSWTQEECDNSDHTLHAAVETVEYNSHTYLFTYVSPKPAFSLNKSQFFTQMEQSFKFLT